MNTGFLRSPSDGRKHAYNLAFLDESHVSAMLDLQEKVLAVLPDRDLFAPSNAEAVARDLGSEGITVGLFMGKELCGYMSLHWVHWDIGRNDELNLEQSAALPHDEIPRVVRFRHSALHPYLQGGGNSVMKIMAPALLERARLFNPPPRYLCSLHSPKNYASLNFPFSLGMLAVRLIINRLGMYRLLCFQDCENPLLASSSDSIAVSGADAPRLLEIIADGYCGYAIDRRESESLIVFGKCEKRDMPRRD